MSKLYDLTQNYQNIADLIEDESVPYSVIETALQAVEADITVKAENIAKLDASLKNDEEAFKAEIERLTARKKAISNRREELKKFLKINLEAVKINKVKCGVFSINIQKSPAALEIIDEKLIPSKYQTLVPEHYDIQKDMVKAALKAGEKVPGAKLTVGTSLRIR